MSKMLKLYVPPPLAEEFATVEALWRTEAKTLRVDALLLSWIKYEKQFRLLFCFLIYQHPAITADTIKTVISAIADNRKLDFEAFDRGITALGVTPIRDLVGAQHDQLAGQIATIRKIRNKLVHGLPTGQSVRSIELERGVRHLIEWIHALAVGAQAEFGYDGLRRNSFKQAKASKKLVVAAYPFSSPETFRDWIPTLLVQKKGPGAKA